MDQRDAWELEYARKGRLWRGMSLPLPDLPPMTRVLELGCGNGKNLAAMARRGWEVTGLDFSPAALELARETLGREVYSDGLAGAGGPVAALVEGDVRSLPFPDGAFDAVFALHVVDHLTEDDAAVALGEAGRVLRPGGRIFLRMFSTGDLRSAKGAGDEVHLQVRVAGTGVSTRYFTVGEVEKLMSGFADVTVRVERRAVDFGPPGSAREWVIGEGTR